MLSPLIFSRAFFSFDFNNLYTCTSGKVPLLHRRQGRRGLRGEAGGSHPVGEESQRKKRKAQGSERRGGGGEREVGEEQHLHDRVQGEGPPAQEDPRTYPYLYR
jgi:hypothetical protein